MRKELVLDTVFWNNDGSTAVLTLTGFSGTVAWFAPTTGVSGSVHTPAVTTDWLKIPLPYKCDEVIVRYRSVIKTIGGLGAVTAATNTNIIAAAEMYDDADSDFATPPEVSRIPSVLVQAGTGGGTNLLGVYAWSAGLSATNSVGLANGSGLTECGLFQVDAAPGNGSAYGWTANLGFKRNFGINSNTSPWAAIPDMSGVRTIWLAIATIQTMAGTLATTKLKGQIRVLGYRHVQDVHSVGYSPSGSQLGTSITA